MTPWSPNQSYPKTTTISRRLRTRTDQDLSVQPPEITHLRRVRPHRVATFPTLRHHSSHFRPSQPHQPPLTWNTEGLEASHQAGDSSIPSSIVPPQPAESPIAQALGFDPYDSAQNPRIDLVSATESHATPEYERHQPSVSETPASPLPVVSGSLDFEPPLSTDSQQLHNPFINLQDMR